MQDEALTSWALRSIGPCRNFTANAQIVLSIKKLTPSDYIIVPV